MPPEPHTRQRPAATGRQVELHQHFAAYSTPNRLAVHSVDPASLLLPRLTGVRQYGKGWRADCPCGHSSRGTLSLKTTDDGRLLLHCFAGCSSADVLATVGLQLADLFPDRRGEDYGSPAERRRRREAVQMADWRAALGALAVESTVVQIAAGMTADGETLGDVGMDRLTIAVERIHGAREVLR